MNENEVYENQPQKKKSGLLTAGWVLGIVGVCTSFIPIVNNASFVLGVLALVFGIIGLVRKNRGKAIVAMILGVAAIAMTLVAQQTLSDAIDEAVDEFNQEMDYLSGNKTQDILKQYLDVSFGSFQVKENEYFDETELTVTVKNKGNETKSFSVTVEAVDESGNRIDQDYVYATSLAAGQAQQFKLFEFVSSEKISALKQATFRVAEVSMY